MSTAASIQENIIESLMAIGEELPQTVKDEMNKIFSEVTPAAQLKGLSPATLETMYSIAHSMYESNQFQKAREIFQTLTMLDHFEFKYFFGLASSYQMERNYRMAIESYGLCYILQPNDPLIPFHCGYCHLMLKDFEAAESGFYAAMEWAEEKPEYADLKERALAMHQLAMRKKEAAKEKCESETALA